MFIVLARSSVVDEIKMLSGVYMKFILFINMPLLTPLASNLLIKRCFVGAAS